MLRLKFKKLLFCLTFSFYKSVFFAVISFVRSKFFNSSSIDLSMFDGKKVLVISPHSDDETLGCGGILQRLSSMGVELNFLLLTRNEGDFELSNKRLNELRNSLMLICNIEDKLLNLHYQDGMLHEHTADIEGEVRDILVNNEIDYVFVTSIFDFHPDHRAASEVCLKLIKDNYIDGVIMYHTNHPVNFKLPLLYFSLSQAERRLKKSALMCFESQSLFDFSSFLVVSRFYSKLLNGVSGYIEPFVQVNGDNVDEISDSYKSARSYIEANAHSKSIMHPYNSIFNIFTWLVRK